MVGGIVTGLVSLSVGGCFAFEAATEPERGWPEPSALVLVLIAAGAAVIAGLVTLWWTRGAKP